MAAVSLTQERTKKLDTLPLVTVVEPANPTPCSTAELEEALKILGGRWKTLIIFHLFSAPVLRLSELQRAIPGVSQKMLIQQLRDLEGHGIVTRKVYPESRRRLNMRYRLTAWPFGQPCALQTWAASRGDAQQ